jgi:hypothetical protein
MGRNKNASSRSRKSVETALHFAVKGGKGAATLRLGGGEGRLKNGHSYRGLRRPGCRTAVAPLPVVRAEGLSTSMAI